jgi:two-component system chemotaxis response regulator CheY
VTDGGLLVADDDPLIRRLVTATLRDVSRFALLEAADGTQAVEIAQRERPAVALLDVDMPGRDGIEVCRALRADPATRAATIVMLTGAPGDGVRARALEAGADLFLTKPFSPLELLRLVDRLGGETA